MSLSSAAQKKGAWSSRARRPRRLDVGAGHVPVEARQQRKRYDDLPVFDLQIRKAARSWEWSVHGPSGDAMMRGRQTRRVAARYEAARALFLMLLSAQLRPRKP